MNCPKCETQMEAGSLLGQGGWWRGKGVTTTIKNFFGSSWMGALSVVAYRCPKCGKIELSSISNDA